MVRSPETLTSYTSNADLNSLDKENMQVSEWGPCFILCMFITQSEVEVHKVCDKVMRIVINSVHSPRCKKRRVCKTQSSVTVALSSINLSIALSALYKA